MTQAQLTRLEQLKRALELGAIDQETFDMAAAAINAQLFGSGAIAQGQEALAVGSQGMVIRGDNSGNLTTGTQLITAEGGKSSTPIKAPPSSLAIRRSRCRL